MKHGPDDADSSWSGILRTNWLLLPTDNLRKFWFAKSQNLGGAGHRQAFERGSAKKVFSRESGSILEGPLTTMVCHSGACSYSAGLFLLSP